MYQYGSSASHQEQPYVYRMWSPKENPNRFSSPLRRNGRPSRHLNNNVYGTSGVDGCSSDNGSSGLGFAAAAAAAANAASGGSPQQRDTTFTKLFVGGLPYHTTDKSLRDHFKVYGEIDEAVVITDRQTGKSRGYGFVIMADRASAERACKEANPIIDGRKANVNLAILGAKPRGNVAAASPFPFTAIRAGYPTSILASQYGLPGSYVYQPAAFGGTPLLSLQSAASSSPALAAALANASANQMSQLYDYQQVNGLGAGVTGMNQPGNAAMAAFASPAAAHFAAAAQAQAQAAAFAAADPYGSSAAYLTAAGGHGHHPNSAQHHAAAYAAYLPQMAAGGMPGAGGNAATSGGIQMSQYAAAVAQDTRIQ